MDVDEDTCSEESFYVCLPEFVLLVDDALEILSTQCVSTLFSGFRVLDERDMFVVLFGIYRRFLMLNAFMRMCEVRMSTVVATQWNHYCAIMKQLGDACADYNLSLTDVEEMLCDKQSTAGRILHVGETRKRLTKIEVISLMSSDKAVGEYRHHFEFLKYIKRNKSRNILKKALKSLVTVMETYFEFMVMICELS